MGKQWKWKQMFGSSAAGWRGKLGTGLKLMWMGRNGKAEKSHSRTPLDLTSL